MSRFVAQLVSSRYVRAQRLASIHSARRLCLLAQQVRLELTARCPSAPRLLRARVVSQQERRRRGLPASEQLQLQGMTRTEPAFESVDVAVPFLAGAVAFCAG